MFPYSIMYLMYQYNACVYIYITYIYIYIYIYYVYIYVSSPCCFSPSERQGHAKEMMMTLTLTDYYGIIIVSGDGLVYEVRNVYRLSVYECTCVLARVFAYLSVGEFL